MGGWRCSWVDSEISFSLKDAVQSSRVLSPDRDNCRDHGTR
jgi:hypothetical protein